MSDILTGISGLLSASWHFLMNTYIPGTQIAFGVLFVGLCVMALGFRFLSLILGTSVGIPETAVLDGGVGYGTPSTSLVKVSKERSLDVR